MSLLLGIDLGTSYFKVGLFDETGEVRGLGRVAVPARVPRPGWCELGVGEFWETLRAGLGAALAQAGATARDIRALSYSSQASTFLLLDARDQPLTPLVMWTDARGAPAPDELQTFARTEAFRRAIGFEGLSDQSAATKWRWFQRQTPALWSRARAMMTISDYLTFALTGERAGDASTAAFLAAYDLESGFWWPEALRKFGVESTQLSAPLRPGSPCGRTGAAAQELLGVPSGVPFAVGALDHHAAALGAGLERLADASISTGTVLAALALVDTPTLQAGCYHGRHTDGSRCWRLAFDARGAGQLEDYQKRFAPKWTIEELLARAAQAPAGSGWETPGVGEHGAAVRAILERVAATHAGLVHTVATGRGPIRNVAATGGGARSALWLQITADLLGLAVITPACTECACLGAAMFAANAAGMQASIVEAAQAMVHAGQIFEPDATRATLYRELMQRTRSEG